MNKGTTIIPFPMRSESKKPKGAGLWPVSLQKHSAGFYDLVIEQCDILVDAMRALFDHIKDKNENSAGKLQAIWKQSEVLREYHLDMLGCSSIRTAEFEEISRISVTLDMAIEHTRTIAVEIFELPIPVDKFMLKMAGNNLIFARTLNQALYKLATNPLQIEQDIRVALYERYQIIKTYRLALATLVRDRDTAGFRVSSSEQLEPLSEICDIFERRKIYHSLYRSCKRLTWITNQIQVMTTHPRSPG